MASFISQSEQEHQRTYADRTLKNASASFIGTYFRRDAFDALNLLRKEGDHYIVGEPEPPTVNVFAYCLADHWDAVWKERSTVDLREITSQDGPAAVLFLNSSEADYYLAELQEARLLEVHRGVPPYQVVRLSDRLIHCWSDFMTEGKTPNALVTYLRSLSLRSRTGILLLQPLHFGKEQTIAVQLGVEALDYADYLHETLPEKTAYANVTAVTEEARLYNIAQRLTGNEVVFIYNFDLVLSKLPFDERTRLWNNLLDRFAKSAKALLIAVPEAATHLLPPRTDYSLWEESNRIAKMI